jgi:hypothetical protein
VSAAQATGLSPSRILVFDTQDTLPRNFVTVDHLIQRGLQMKAFSERKLRPGEGKTKLAFLSFSSGTYFFPAFDYSNQNL